MLMMTNVLQQVLYPDSSSAECYQSYFIRRFWTPSEFGALITGMTPRRYDEIGEGRGEPPSRSELAWCQDARRIVRRLINCPDAVDLRVDGDKLIKYPATIRIRVEENELVASCSQYIKWLAQSGQLPTVKFAKALPIELMETFLDFQPIDEALRTLSRYSQGYHQALYLKHGRELMEESETLWTPLKLYRHPRMERVRHCFIGDDRKRKYYKKRTIVESWIPKLFPKNRGRGRPKKARQGV